jgi:hypothetical protein
VKQNPEDSVSKKLSGQGEQLDAEQVMRLELAGDPIYAHIATLATATALNGLIWEQRPTLIKRKQQLRVTRLNKRKPFKKLENGIDGEIEIDDNVKLIGRVRLDNAWRPTEEYPRAFDKSIDEALIRTSVSASLTRFILSSSIMLERRSEVINGNTIKLGVIARHAAEYQHRADEVAVSTVNQAADPAAFEGLMNIINRVDGDEDEEESTYYGRHTLLRTQQRISTTSDPGLHFNFHEALGADEKTLSIARENYEALRAHLGLPYKLPDDTSLFD